MKFRLSPSYLVENVHKVCYYEPINGRASDVACMRTDIFSDVEPAITSEAAVFRGGDGAPEYLVHVFIPVFVRTGKRSFVPGEAR